MKSEYTLHTASKQLDDLNDSEKYLSSNDRLALLEEIYKALETNTDTTLTEHRSYKLKARVAGQLSELAVWGSERSKYADQAQEYAKTTLNINPYNFTNWALAIDLSKGNPLTDSWMLGKLQNSGDWSKGSQLYASFYCLTKWQLITKSVAEQCRKTVIDLQSDEVFSNKMRNSIERFPKAKIVLQEILSDAI